MADHSPNAVPNQAPSGAAAVPDYDLADRLELGPDQLKLMLEPTRLRIIDLLSERAATTSQLADVLERPKGTVGHHCKALEKAGLIHVVRTARVRAIEERYYGRVARLFIMGSLGDAGVSVGTFLDDSFRELKAAVEGPYVPDEAHLASARYARIPTERAHEWSERFSDLLDEFAGQVRGGEVTYGVMVGLFRTDRSGFDDSPDGAPTEPRREGS